MTLGIDTHRRHGRREPGIATNLHGCGRKRKKRRKRKKEKRSARIPCEEAAPRGRIKEIPELKSTSVIEEVDICGRFAGENGVGEQSVISTRFTSRIERNKGPVKSSADFAEVERYSQVPSQTRSISLGDKNNAGKRDLVKFSRAGIQ